MNEVPDHITHEKLARYLAGEASEAETEEINSWAAASPKNAHLLHEWQTVWADTGGMDTSVPTPGTYDVDAAWQKVKARTQATGHRTYFSAWWKVAASIVLLAGAGLMALYFTPEPPAPLTYTAATPAEVLNMHDGSSVTLNAGSQITYPAAFEGSERRVWLRGEAFFEVEPNPEAPFIIVAGPTTVQVLGTAFNVKTNADQVTVLVESGKVLFSGGEQQVILEAGMRGAYTSSTASLGAVKADPSAGAEQFWRTKTLRFTGHPLPEVIETLETAYGVRIRLGNEALSRCSLSVTFRDDSLENVLEVIALTLNLEVTRTGREIILNGKECRKN